MNVENVLLFVADSLRWDHLPDSVDREGVTFKTVAQSTFSAPSFATLVTGLYPPEHGVYGWENRMPAATPTMFDIGGVDGGFWQAGEVTGHAIYPILQRDGKRHFDDIDPPFVFLERNDDPHLPYAGTEVDSAAEYYDTRGGDRERIRAEYATGVEHSASAFHRRLDDLSRRGLREETLVVFTSDHGELLGEYGEVAHTAPMCPELAYVPTVFCHPDLDGDSFAVDPASNVVEHVDVVATILGLLDRNASLSSSGVDLRTSPRGRPWGYSHVDINRWNRSFYVAEGVWGSDGGHVRTRNRVPLRLAYALARLRGPAAAYTRRNLPTLFRTYLQSTATYGTPPVAGSTAANELERFRDGLGTATTRTVTLDEATEHHLEQLGYR